MHSVETGALVPKRDNIREKETQPMISVIIPAINEENHRKCGSIAKAKPACCGK
jgi:cellulose synthase/poly-beta-1,6-N-acetylglucosamine synthase-like glycosyltransferase